MYIFPKLFPVRWLFWKVEALPALKVLSVYNAENLRVVITPAIDYLYVVIPAKAGHVVKLQRYPGRYWKPDQVRHYRIGIFCCLVNIREKGKL